MIVRDDAARLLEQWENSRQYIEDILHAHFREFSGDARDRRFLQEIVYGAVRWIGLLDYMLKTQYHGQFHKAEYLVKNLLRLGLYQILFMESVPEAVAIHETVESSKRLNKSEASGLINGVLRSVLRERKAIEAEIHGLEPVRRLSVQESHPEWLVQRWIDRYGEESAIQLCRWNNRSQDVTIRANTTQVSLDQIVSRMKREEIPFTQSEYLPEFFVLSKSQQLFSGNLIPDEWYAVQDQAAGLASSCVQPSRRDLVIDGCSAPGGKATYLRQRYGNSIDIFAGDISIERLKKVPQLIRRLQLSDLNYICMDARTYPLPKAERILLDVPCSGTGVMGKRVDARWRLEEKHISKFAGLQSGILNNASQALKPGGIFIYSTCTLEPEENWGIIENFLETHPDFSIITQPGWIPEQMMDQHNAMQTLPHRDRMDGAFTVRLQRS